MNVNPGELNKRIRIEQPAGGKDADGYDTEPANALVHACWAKFSRISGTELIKANGDFGRVNCRFLVRYTTKELSRKMIVQYGGDDYEIQYINDYEDSHEYLEIWCERTTLEG